MEKIQKIIILNAVLVAMISVGCGRGKAEIPLCLDTLSALGRARANPVTQEGRWPETPYALASYKEVKPAKGPNPPSTGGRPLPVASPIPSPNPSASPSPDIGNAIKILGNICEIQRTEILPGRPRPKDFEMSVGGQACPIEFVAISQSHPTGELAQVHFKARSEMAQHLSDINLMDLKIEFLPGDRPEAALLRSTVTGNSQKNGEIEMKLEGSIEWMDDKNLSGTISGHLAMGNLEAEVRHVIHLVKDTESDEIYINDVRLSEDQVRQVIAAFPHVQKSDETKVFGN